MPITPLHIAFAWPFRMKFLWLSFAPLTLGSMVSDIEVPVLFILGFPPYRLVTHSLLGALTINVVLTIVLLKLFTYLNLQKLGIMGFDGANFKREILSSRFIVSAWIGSLSHVLIDSLHHQSNPLFWPFGPTYVSGPMVVMLGLSQANLIVHLLAIGIIFYIVKKLLNVNGLGFLLLLRNPVKAIFIVTQTLNKVNSTKTPAS